MNNFILITLSVVLLTCGSNESSNINASHDANTPQVVAIAELPSKLGLTPMNTEPLKGVFESFFSDYESGVFKSVFVTQKGDEMPLMRYLSYTSMSIADTLQVSENEIALPITHKMDPNSMKAYRMKAEGTEWILLTGRAPSASGRGARKMLYALISSHDNGLYSLLSSALGRASSFGHCDKSGEILFVELNNSTKKVDSYNLTVKEIGGKGVVEMQEAEMTYNMNDSLVYFGELPTLCSTSYH